MIASLWNRASKISTVMIDFHKFRTRKKRGPVTTDFKLFQKTSFMLKNYMQSTDISCHRGTLRTKCLPGIKNSYKTKVDIAPVVCIPPYNHGTIVMCRDIVLRFAAAVL